ncbi:MAG: outer membrane lipoprotein LolB [Gammaproteobacteria bacterium]|nr:outer membrane lipoprotein LolB [Gammaproteobacteria bacterium]
MAMITPLTVACVSVNQMDDAMVEALRAQNRLALERRSESLAEIQNWQIDGRISVTTDDEAWSGKLYWQQNANDYQINFSAPSGQGALQLLSGEWGVELRLANGGLYTATDTDTLLREQIGWDLPISGLWYWIRGLPNPDMAQSMRLNEQGLIRTLEQGEWSIQYDRYQQYQGYQFPRKIFIESEDMSVRLIVSQWNVH